MTHPDTQKNDPLVSIFNTLILFILFRNIQKPALKKVPQVEYSDIIPIPLPSKSGSTGDTPIFKIEDTSHIEQKSSEVEIDGVVQVKLISRWKIKMQFSYLHF